MLMSYLCVKHLTFGRVYATNHGDQFSYCINILLEVTSALGMTILPFHDGRQLSYRNQSIDLLRKLMDWFLYDNGRRHGRVNRNDRNLNFIRYYIWQVLFFGYEKHKAAKIGAAFIYFITFQRNLKL